MEFEVDDAVLTPYLAATKRFWQENITPVQTENFVIADCTHNNLGYLLRTLTTANLHRFHRPAEGPPIYRTPRIGGSHVKYGNCTIGEEAPLFS